MNTEICCPRSLAAAGRALHTRAEGRAARPRVLHCADEQRPHTPGLSQRDAPFLAMVRRARYRPARRRAGLPCRSLHQGSPGPPFAAHREAAPRRDDGQTRLTPGLPAARGSPQMTSGVCCITLLPLPSLSRPVGEIPGLSAFRSNPLNTVIAKLHDLPAADVQHIQNEIVPSTNEHHAVPMMPRRQPQSVGKGQLGPFR